MNNRVMLGIADQVLIGDLVSRIDALEDYDVIHISESTQDIVPAVLNHNPDVLIVDQDLPPGPITRATYDIGMRRPALPILLATRSNDEESLSLGLQIGARGVLAYPFVLADVNDALQRSSEWGERMQEMLAGRHLTTAVEGGIVSFAGSKGGVGTSILTSHLGWRLAHQHPTKRVCLVDLDLEKGDITSYIDLSYRVSIVDLAKIADDITDREVRDTVAVHDSGLHILPAPVDVRDVDLVSAPAIRNILSQLRQAYDAVLVDVGSNVTPAQAAAVEMSDHAIQVVTTDVPSLRSARRQAQTWSDLGVRDPGDVQVLVNRYSRDAEIQQATVDRLVLGRRLETLIPDLGRGLEAAVNTRTPSQGAPKAWWKALDSVTKEAEIVIAEEAPSPVRRGLFSGSRRRGGQEPPAPATDRQPVEAGKRESGQVALETVGLLPITVILILLLWQIVGLALSFLWAGHAANAAAREASLGSSTAQVQQAARDAVPPGVDNVMQVSSSGSSVTVRVKIAPVGAGSAASDVGVRKSVVREPNG